MILEFADHFDWENFTFGEKKCLLSGPFLSLKIGGCMPSLPNKILHFATRNA